jgi:hypothetical protein
MVDSFNDFVQRWITPFTVLTFFGAVIWGVQLNYITLQLTEAVAVQKDQIDRLRRDDAAVSVTLAQGIMVQQHIVKALERIEEQLDQHDDEAEEWKRKILLNEQKLKSNGE